MHPQSSSKPLILQFLYHLCNHGDWSDAKTLIFWLLRCASISMDVLYVQVFFCICKPVLMELNMSGRLKCTRSSLQQLLVIYAALTVIYCCCDTQAKDQLLSETLENISRHRAEQNKQAALKYVLLLPFLLLLLFSLLFTPSSLLLLLTINMSLTCLPNNYHTISVSGKSNRRRHSENITLTSKKKRFQTCRRS